MHKGDALATVGKAGLVASRTAAASSLEAALTQLDEDEDAGASDVQVAADQAAVVSARATLADARQAVDRRDPAGHDRRHRDLRRPRQGRHRRHRLEPAAAPPPGWAATAPTPAPPGHLDRDDLDRRRPSSYVVDATVAAADVDQLKKGLQAEIAATGVTDTVYGTVSEVGLVAADQRQRGRRLPGDDRGHRQAEGPVRRRLGHRGGHRASSATTCSPSSAARSRPRTARPTSPRSMDGKESQGRGETGETYGMTTEIDLRSRGGRRRSSSRASPGPPDGGGNRRGGQEGFPGGGEMPDFSQMGGGGGPQLTGTASDRPVTPDHRARAASARPTAPAASSSRRCAGSTRRSRGRVRRGGRAVGLRQVDADEHPRLPRHPHRGQLPARRRGRVATMTEAAAGRGPQPADRLRLPAVQPARQPVRVAQRRAAAGVRRRTAARAARAGRSRPWPGSASADRVETPTGRALRRPAAARRGRPGAGHRAGDDPGRRADRQPRLARRPPTCSACSTSCTTPAAPSC